MPTKQRYAVSLDGFEYCGHRGPDGKVHLAPIHRAAKAAQGKTPAVKAYETAPENLTEYTVEAYDVDGAEGVFKRLMGILKTGRDFSIKAA